MLVSFARLSLSCGGGAVVPVVESQPYEGIGWIPLKKEAAPISLEFRVDTDGQPVSIRRLPTPDFYVPGSEDLAPALAAWRFAPANPRERCTVTFRPRATPIAEAPHDRLARYYATPHAKSSWDRQVFEALVPEGADCDRPRPAPRTLRYPDYEKVPQNSGTAAFVLAGYDLDARGTPDNVRVLASSGNEALDREVVKAIARSRFAPGARQGCIVRFGRGPRTPLAPPPLSGDFKTADACPNEPAWQQMPPLRFPANFRRRSIEGWAVLRFDVAPWGQVGNVQVVASEPAEEFGTAAKQIVEAARKPSSERGYSGCIQTVRFRMGNGVRENSEEPPVVTAFD